MNREEQVRQMIESIIDSKQSEAEMLIDYLLDLERQIENLRQPRVRIVMSRDKPTLQEKVNDEWQWVKIFESQYNGYEH